jgi:hypothetical protein
MLRFVEEHIDRLALAAANVSGVVQDVDPTRLSATVVFDGSTVGVPVKVLGHVYPLAGDRVLVSRVGPRRRRKSPDEAYAGEEWVVVGVSSRVTGPNVAVANFSQGTGTVSSSTIIDLPGTTTTSFYKRFDDTALLLYLAFTNEVTVANSTLAAYLTFTQGSLFSQIKMAEIESVLANAAFGPAHFRVAPDPAGAPTFGSGYWDVKVQWARSAGTGTFNSAAGKDHASLLVMELGT